MMRPNVARFYSENITAAYRRWHDLPRPERLRRSRESAGNILAAFHTLRDMDERLGQRNRNETTELQDALRHYHGLELSRWDLEREPNLLGLLAIFPRGSALPEGSMSTSHLLARQISYYAGRQTLDHLITHLPDEPALLPLGCQILECLTTTLSLNEGKRSELANHYRSATINHLRTSKNPSMVIFLTSLATALHIEDAIPVIAPLLSFRAAAKKFGWSNTPENRESHLALRLHITKALVTLNVPRAIDAAQGLLKDVRGNSIPDSTKKLLATELMSLSIETPQIKGIARKAWEIAFATPLQQG